MCGICGTVEPNPDHATIGRMNDTLHHRGPDDSGLFADDHAAIAMRRLSIIDLAGGRQPISDSSGRYHLVFNGELYNYRPLRAQLRQHGRTFATNSDSEVVLQAYLHWGRACLDHFNGMFALAIWDSQQRALFIARDRLGIKPLYYSQHNGRFFFASELKAILAHPHAPRTIDPAALTQFLTYEYIPAPHSIITGIHKLLPGHWLHYTDGRIETQPYWHLPLRERAAGSSAQLTAQFTELLTDAIKLRLISDVPLGAFLSGGIDSSAIVALMSAQQTQPVQTFSIGFGDPTYNELPYARAVAHHFRTDHHERFLQPNVVDLTTRLLTHLDEPLGDFSILPTYLVSQLAREHVTVVLSGDGGDEILGGYDTYRAQCLANPFDRLGALRTDILPTLFAHIRPRPAKKGLINKLKRFTEGAALSPSLQHVRWMTFLNPTQRDFLFNGSVHAPESTHLAHFRAAQGIPSLTQQQYVDLNTYLPANILCKVDRMSMATSLEARTPFLDHRLVEFAFRLPPHLRFDGRTTKIILRNAMQEILPPAVLTKPKEGFSIPIKQWLNTTLWELLNDQLRHASDHFHQPTINRWLHEQKDGRINHSHRLWSLLAFEMWRSSLI